MDLPTLSPEQLHESQQGTAQAITIACAGITFVAMILRSFGRYCLKLKNDRERINSSGHYLGLDDIFNFFAVLTFFALCAAVLVAIHRGMGTHIQLIIKEHGMEGVDRYNLAIYNCAVFYNSTLGFVKLSVLSLYRRILFGIPSKKLLIINWTLFGIVSLNTAINVFIAIFQCKPIEGAFTMSVHATAECINPNAFYLGNAITGIITDASVYALAYPIVRPLQMERKKKIVTLMTLLVGAFAVATSCIRLGFLPPLLRNPDATWAMGVPMIWSVVEPAVGIVVSSVPAITAIRHFRSSKIYGYGSHTSSTTRSGKHVHLQDFGNTGTNKSKVTSFHDRARSHGSRGNTSHPDDTSEEHLVDERNQAINRTVEVRLSYERK